MNNEINLYDINPRPYEKSMRYGVSTLSDAELLAVILRTGSKGINALELSRKILDAGAPRNGLLGLYHMTIGLCNVGIHELMKIKGIGKVKAIQIQAIVELAKRLSKGSISERKSFSNPKLIANYYMQDMMHLEVEKVLLVMLDNKCKLICDMIVSQGTVNSSVISPREIIIEALKHRAVFIVIIHNHPSGDPTPSNDDYNFTDRLKRAAEIVDIPLLDHIIIGNNQYISLKETGKC